MELNSTILSSTNFLVLSLIPGLLLRTMETVEGLSPSNCARSFALIGLFM